MLKSKDRPTPRPVSMSKEQMGQQSRHHMSSFPSSSSSSSSIPLPHTPPSASRLRTCITAENAGLPATPTAQYLSDLRHARPPRPAGARTPPSSKFTAVQRAETELVDAKSTDSESRPSLPTSSSMPIMPTDAQSHRRSESGASKHSIWSARGPFAGRPLVTPPTTGSEAGAPSSPERPVKRHAPSLPYMEHGMRWMEKQEARSLREALQDMDLEEEKKIHAEAQDEAAELVYKHQYPEAAAAPGVIVNPDLKNYRSHLRKGSYQRSHSRDTNSAGHRTSSDGSQSPDTSITAPGKRATTDRPRTFSPPAGNVSVQKRRESTGKSHDHLAQAVEKDIVIAHRRSSSGSRRILSGEKKMYMHPNDKIWEDPQEDVPSPEQPAESKRDSVPAASPVPSYVRKNPFARVRAQAERLERSNSAPVISSLPSTPVLKHDRIEIQRNAPSQSRNPWYLANEPLPPTPPSASDREADEVAPKTTPTREGKEIRGEDIRAATSKGRKDYSPNLPRPTMVSHKPGRPIVSFQKDYKPKEIVMEEQHSAPAHKQEAEASRPSPYQIAKPPPPQATVNSGPMPPIPTINVPDEPSIPSIVLPEEPPGDASRSSGMPGMQVEAPSINVSVADDSTGRPTRSKIAAHRPLPSTRPLPRHAATTPFPATKSTPHYTPSMRQAGALCAHCALPIAGRILSAAGQRFHPGCFVCHECSTNLECVAFYPEPERKREERLERDHVRHAGFHVPMPEDMTEEQFLKQEATDGDDSLRFYCHLDYHELFSPRCKSCKTPIEGEVIVACGAEWHAGHFFCAQCGDPFDSTMPFVEKDGYAWCVGCHTKRYSSKCRKCKKAVTDVVVKALGSDWHSDCFVCMECSGEFTDGRYFLRGDSQDPVCVSCEERRLKA